MDRLLESLAEFLHVLGFAFLVPGFVALGGVICCVVVGTPAEGVALWEAIQQTPLNEWSVALISGLLLSYTLGHVVFATGRWIARRWRFKYGKATGEQLLEEVAYFSELPALELPASARRLIESLEIAAREFALAGRALERVDTPEEERTRRAKERARLIQRAERIYVMLWAQMRLRDDASFRLVQQYWMLTALLDGLVAATFPWMAFVVVVCVRGLSAGSGTPGWAYLVMTALVLLALLLVARVLFGEANRYRSYQVQELVASFYTPPTSGSVELALPAPQAPADPTPPEPTSP